MPLDLVAGPLNERVVEAIRAEMSRQRVSQAWLGKMLGHDQAYVSWRLLGKTQLRLNEVEEIAQVLGVPLDLLLLADSPLAARRRRRAS